MGTDKDAAADDPRIRMAAEQTLLAWVRTGLSLMGFGFVVSRFGLFLRELAAVRPDLPPHQGTVSQWIGVSLVLLGVAALVFTAANHRGMLRQIEHGQPLAAHRGWAGIILAGVLAGLGMFIAAYLLFVTH
jgi:putative membrane protein